MCAVVYVSVRVYGWGDLRGGWNALEHVCVCVYFVQNVGV